MTNYYNIQSAIIQAAATLAAGMPEPTGAEIDDALGDSYRDKLINIYSERFQMAFYAIRKNYIDGSGEKYPEIPADSN